MTHRDFVYWLQGFLEIDGADDQKREGLSTAQVEVIKKHIALVLNNVTSGTGNVHPALIGPHTTFC